MRPYSLVLITASLFAACGDSNPDPDVSESAARTVPGADSASVGTGGATAVVHDAAGRELGSLTLADTANGVVVSGELRGLPPGEHGFHLHTTGQCAPDFEAAGAHWNPTNRQHGRDNPQGAHLGDMANIVVGADSSVNVHVITPGGMLRGQNALLDADGAAVMVHAAPDDYRSDPSGEAGDRIACGIVRALAGADVAEHGVTGTS